MPLIDLIGGIGMVSIAGTLRATPAYLALALAMGAVLALALILIATARRRRRDGALSKALGFTQRQLASVVAWHSTVAALFEIVFGIPLGIVVRRQLWTLFAQRQHRARPDGSVLVRGPYGAAPCCSPIWSGAQRGAYALDAGVAPSNYERPAIRPMRRYNLASSFLG